MRGIAHRLVRALRLTLLIFAVLTAGAVLIGTLPSLLGYDSFVVTGNSMEPAIPRGAIVVAERVPVERIEAGDVITFRPTSESRTLVTHRVMKVRPEPTIDGVTVITQGDANQYADPVDAQLTGAVSRLVFFVPLAGHVLAFARSPIGAPLTIVVPVGLLAASFRGIGRRPSDSVGVVDTVPPDPGSLSRPSASMVSGTPPIVERLVAAAPRRAGLIIENHSPFEGVVFPQVNAAWQLRIAPGGQIALEEADGAEVVSSIWFTSSPAVQWHVREVVSADVLRPPELSWAA